MVYIESPAWAAMVAHAERDFPDECCGAMVGFVEQNLRIVARAVPLENVSPEPHARRYEIRTRDLLDLHIEAAPRGLAVIGIYHSHPDCDAGFSATDIANSAPFYSFLVLALRAARFHHAKCWIAGRERSSAAEEELSIGSPELA